MSTLLTWMCCALLPPPWGLVLFVSAVAVLGLLVAGVGEPGTARLLYRARRLDEHELAAIRPALTLLCRGGLGPPVVELWICRRDRRLVVEPLGRHTIVVADGVLDAVAAGRLSQKQAAALIGHTASLVRDGWYRHDLALSFWSLPWLTIRGLARGLAASLGSLPLIRVGWQLRLVVVTIAVVQAVQQGTVWVGVLLLVLAALSYLMPAWERQWHKRLRRAGDQALVNAGLAAPWASLLRRHPITELTRQRLLRLEPTPTPGPALAPVVSVATEH